MNSQLHYLRHLTLAVIILVTSLSVTFPQQAQAEGHDVQQQVTSHTKEEIASKWLKYRPLATGSSYMNKDQAYSKKPSLTAPYSEGKIKPEYILDGLNATNFVRYLAGLPDDLEPDWNLEKQQQTAALVNAVNDQLTHYPTMPAGMDESMFKLGEAGTKSSNIYMGSPTFYENVIGYMSDSDTSNIDRVGHRRWILNPSMKKTMFGMVHADSPYAAMYAFNKDRDPKTVKYEYVSWPSAGYFPEEFFDTQDAWSVSLNPDLYNKKRTENIAVTLTRVSDGRTWSFDSNDNNKSSKYFNVENSGFGIPFAIIFRPDQLESFASDDRFNVNIKGLYDNNGQEAAISYSTTFFKLQSDLKSRNTTISLQVGETLQLPYFKSAIMNNQTFTSSDKGIVKVDNTGKVTAISTGSTEIYLNDYTRNMSSALYIIVNKANKEEIVSSWAQNAYSKAKAFGIVSFYYDHSYKQPITREEFTSMTVEMIETITRKNLFTTEYDIGNSPFKDIDSWLITWASANGIINGLTTQTFAPEQTITREQASRLLLNVHTTLLKMTGKQAAQKEIPVAKFTDDARICGWAKQDVYKAVELSLMNGTDNNQFNPKGKLTYEQTYVLLLRLFESFDQDTD